MSDILKGLVAVHKNTGFQHTIAWYDDKVIAYPVPPQEILATFTIREKKLECSAKTKWKQEVVYDILEPYEILELGQDKFFVTYQGFYHKLMQSMLLRYITCNCIDLRYANDKKGIYPKPDFRLMGGFRFSQRELITNGLLKGMSGLIGACTRYGKTTLIINTLKAFPTLSTVVVAPGVDLVKQLYDDINGPRGIPKGSREVKLICTGRGRTPAMSPGGITVCSADSLDKCDYNNTELLLADEPHSLVTANRLEKINAFTRARRIGFGATLKGRFDGRDSLITGLFGPVLVERTYKEAVAEGAVCPLSIIFLKVQLPQKSFRDRNSAYNSLLFHNADMMTLANRICKEVIPQDWQTMVFIKDETQAEMLLEAMNDDATIAMAKRMTNKERSEVDQLMKQNIIKRCLCTKIYVQGVTFSDVRVLLNLEGGGNNTSAIQKPGRLAEIRPGKKCGIVIDLLFTAPGGSSGNSSSYALCIDSKNRKKAYEEIGYDIHVVDNITELKTTFDSLC